MIGILFKSINKLHPTAMFIGKVLKRPIADGHFGITKIISSDGGFSIKAYGRLFIVVI